MVAGKTQQANKNQRNGIHDHAVSILVFAFRAFVFREVGDRYSVRGTRSRPESYDTAIKIG